MKISKNLPLILFLLLSTALILLLPSSQFSMADKNEIPANTNDQDEAVDPQADEVAFQELLNSARNDSSLKKEWPEVVGLSAEEAEKKIKEETPHVQIQIVSPNQFVTMEYNTGRVRLYLDSAGLVARTPRRG